MQPDWDIQRRADKCSVTSRPFEDGEYFRTLLFRDKRGLYRMDLSEEAWKEQAEKVQPFSYWRSKFELPQPPSPEALPKQGVESLLRQLMLEDREEHINARYILAVMLERKKVLKQVDEKPAEEGRLLIYEHFKTGEAFIIFDPMLRMDQIEAVQAEVFALLNGGEN
ncbi:MAG TPA: hypothetical protein VIT21_03710 [Chthoniobacterales bacterium]